MCKQESNESGDISCSLSANGCDIVVDKRESNEASPLDTCTRLCINYCLRLVPPVGGRMPRVASQRACKLFCLPQQHESDAVR